MEAVRGEYIISTDKNLLTLSLIHDFLSNKAYWAKGRTLEQVKMSIDHSICFGLYHQGKQVGFARVFTDYGTQYVLSDVFILENYRGRGLGKWLIETVTSYGVINNLQGMLLTGDAHGLYEQYGFVNNEEYGKKFMIKKPKQ